MAELCSPAGSRPRAQGGDTMPTSEEGGRAGGWVRMVPLCSLLQGRMSHRLMGMGVLTLAAGAGLSQPKGLGLLSTQEEKGAVVRCCCPCPYLAPDPARWGGWHGPPPLQILGRGCFAVGAVGCSARPASTHQMPVVWPQVSRPGPMCPGDQATP